jgi:hypothetical protein
MTRTRRPRPPYAQSSMPSQAPSTLTPFMPGTMSPDMQGMGELQKKHKHGYGGAPPVYVISTFDARPVNAVDFNVYSGTNAGGTAHPDTGWHPQFAPLPAPPFFTSSLFYTVQAGRVAAVRDWQITVAPATGEELGGELGNPIFYPGGPTPMSNFRLTISFLVDGVFQEGHSGLVNWQAAFGDIAGECYILARPFQTIELRISGINPGGSSWNQALMSMHGNLLQDHGWQVQFEPCTDVTLPVHEMGAPT